jgi:hypothetical protein
MKMRLAAFFGLVVCACGALLVAALWTRRMAGSSDSGHIDNAAYFVHTWMITFIVCAVAAAFMLVNIIIYKRRRHYDNDNE